MQNTPTGCMSHLPTIHRVARSPCEAVNACLLIYSFLRQPTSIDNEEKVTIASKENDESCGSPHDKHLGL